MSRQCKTGLSYFPLVVGFFEDKRIRRLIARFGADGAAAYLYLLCRIYEQGYYVEYTDDLVDDAALDINCSPEKIGLVVSYLLDKSLLNNKLFSTVKALSSHGIQTQYQEAMRKLKRDVEVDGKFWLLNEDETLGFIKVRPFENKSEKKADKSEILSDKSEKKALKKRKENKRKEKESIEAFQPPTLQAVIDYCKERKSSVNPKKFFDYFDVAGWIDSKGNPVKNWKQKLITWENNEREKEAAHGRVSGTTQAKNWGISYDT